MSFSPSGGGPVDRDLILIRFAPGIKQSVALVSIRVAAKKWHASLGPPYHVQPCPNRSAYRREKDYQSSGAIYPLMTTAAKALHSRHFCLANQWKMWRCRAKGHCIPGRRAWITFKGRAVADRATLSLLRMVPLRHPAGAINSQSRRTQGTES
jgi:hypothetical protein